MFDKVKELNKLRKMQGEMQKELEAILVTFEKDGVEVTMRGDKKIEKVTIDGEENKLFKEIINKVSKEVDKKVQKQMQGKMSELGLPGL